MPEFRHTRTGKIIHASEADAFRYRNNRYEPIGEPGKRIELPAGNYNTSDVPKGTIAEVLAWAGDDPVRRVTALIAEQGATGKRRKGIIDALS
jgi:hypothetical protein